MQIVFGMDKEYLLCEPNIKYGSELLNEIMIGGNFGQYNKANRVRKESYAHWAWKRIKRRLQYIRYDSESIVFRPLYRIKVAIVKSQVLKKYISKKSKSSTGGEFTIRTKRRFDKNFGGY